MLAGVWGSVLTQAGIYAIAVVGLQLALRAGCFSVMHAALLGIAAYMVGYGQQVLGLPAVPAALLAIAVAAAVGGVTAILMTRLEGLFFAIGTLAVGQVLSFVVQVLPGFGGAVGLSGISLTTMSWWVFLALALVMAAVLRAERTTTGVALFVTGKDPTVASAMGLSVRRARVVTFAVSAGIAGLAGVFYAHYVGLIGPSDLNFAAETNLLLFLVVGGVETPWGAVVGTFGIQALLQVLGASQLDRYWIFGLLVIVVVLLRPRGLLGRPALRLRGVDGVQPPPRAALPGWRDALSGWRGAKVTR